MTARPFDPANYAYTAVAYVTVTFGGGTWRGSGVLISPDELLTADHMAFSSDEGVATDVQVSPGYNNGTAPFGAIPGAVAHYDAGIRDGSTITNEDSQSDFAVIHLARPVAGAGNMAVTPGFAGGAVHVTGFPGSAGEAMVDDVQTVAADPSYTLWDGTSIGAGSSGGPVWTYGADGRPNVVGLVSSETSDGTGYDVRITPGKAAQIAAWVAQDDAGLGLTQAAPPVASLSILDTTTGKAIADTLSRPFSGAVPGVVEQYVSVTADSLSITARSPNYFIHTGSGNDAVQLLAGVNVVDGGAGSNFLVGGEGRDTFFIDDRSSASPAWSTVSRFHSGDAVTLWGLSPGGAAVSWADMEGAAGASGLTLHAAVPGRPMASLTLAGFTTADLASGRVQAHYGSAGGSDYLGVRAA